MRVLLTAAAAFLFSLASMTAAAGPTWIRLVDAAKGVPLEFWEKTDTGSAAGMTLHWRMPTAVYVDGKAIAYGHHGRDTSAGLSTTEDTEKIAGMAEVEKELGMSAPEEAQIRSDRASQVLGGTGVMAAVSGEFADGEHVVWPGGHKFTIGKGAVAAVSGALVKSGPAAVSLRCLPVDINLPAPAQVTIMQNNLKIFEGVLDGAGAQVLRLFLPVSAEDYAVNVRGEGEFRFRLADAGVQLQGTPVLAEGRSLEARGFTLALWPVAGKLTPVKPPAEAATSELYLLTDRNREVFAEGELVQFSVRAYGPAADGDRVSLTLEQDGRKLPLPVQPLLRNGGAAAAELEVDTALLRPGAYQVQAHWGTTVSNPLPLEIVSVLPVTNLKLFGYNKWGSSSFEPKDLAAAVRNGLNLVVQGGGHGQGGHVMAPQESPFTDWVTREPRPADKSRFKDWQKANFPPELLDLPLEHDAGAEFLLANGIQNVPVVCNLILYFNVGQFWKHHADDRNQAVQHFGQEWRRFPNFLGMVHCTGDGPTPATMGMVWAAGAGSFDIIHEERMKKLREAFEFKVGKLTIDDSAVKAEFDRINSQMQGAIGYGVGMNTGVKVEGDDAVKLEWNKWVNDLYPACFREERTALAAMMPDPIVNCSWTWGGGIGGGMWAETFYRSLDNVVTDLHGDYGIVPLAYSCGADTLGFGQKTRPWQSLDLLPERPFANGLKLFLEGLSRNPAGIGVLNTHGEVAGGWGDQKETSEGMSILMDIGRRFGDLFMGLERRDEIAVIGSMRQAALGGQTPGILYGAHFLATKAGYQANAISEDECVRDPAMLNRFKAVFLVSMTAGLPAELETALAAFQKQGGKIIADEASKVTLPDVLRVKVIELNGANEVNFRAVYDAFAPLVKAFRDTVGPQVKPFFTSTAPHAHLVRSADGDLEYWTLFNDTLLSPEENPNGHFIQFLYKGVEADLTAARAGVVYDAFRRQSVAAKEAGSALAWHADMRLLSGTVYLCAERPIEALAVTASRQVAPGALLQVSARAVDAAGKAFTGRLPIEIAVTDPAGALRYRLYRTTNREVLLKIAGNDPAGEWHWAVTDQATGLAAKGAFTVAGDAVLPAVKPLADLVYDAPAVYGALRTRDLDIVLFPDQLALHDTATALAGKLREAGVKATVRVFWPSMVRPYPMNWKEFTVEDEEIHEAVLAASTLGLRVSGKNQEGTTRRDPMKFAYYSHYTGSAEEVYYRDVILLGRGDVPSNPMFDLVTRQCRMLPRNPSPSFPASGFGLVGYAWAPFHYGQDAIVLYGRDAAGLERAGATLLTLAAAKSAPAPVRMPRLAGPKPQDGQIYAGFGLQAAAPAPEPVTSRERIATSLLPPTFDLRLAEVTAQNGRVFAKLDSKLDPKAPPFAVIDLAASTARRLNSATPAGRASALEPLVRGETDTWSSPRLRRVADGCITPVGKGLARFDNAGAVKWYCDPFPVAGKYDEAKYPRRCQQFLVSPDERWILAVFYDAGAGANYGPSYRTFNQGATVLLDAATGREICRAAGFLAGPMALAEDASRFVLVDNVEIEAQGRSAWNPHGGMVIAAFDKAGKELSHFPGSGVQMLRASRDAAFAAVSYSDARRYVSLFDVLGGREVRMAYPRIDVGIAVAPAGDFAVISYADGLVRQVAPDGKIMHDWQLPAPGMPAVTDKGEVIVCAQDGNLYFPGTERKPIAFLGAAAEELKVPVATPAAGLTPPTKPFWTTLGKTVKQEPLPPPADAAALASVKGEKQLVVDLPKLAPLDIVLVTFNYRLQQPTDVLKISFNAPDGQRVTYLYPYLAQSQPASVPLRTKTAGPLTLTFAADDATLDTIAVTHLKLDGFSNAAAADLHKKSANPNSPRIMVPNVHGALGDPRVEQVAFGFPAKGSFTLPPDLQGKTPPATDAYSLFDGNIHAGTPLYPTVFPGAHPWNPPQVLNTLRSAQVIIEFPKPCAAEAVAVWEHPGDFPVRAFTLEYATSADVKAGEKGEIPGDWKLAVEGRDNIDPCHVHAFAAPISARVWRYTILDTPSCVQRIAEIELYQSAVDALEGDINTDAPAGAAEPGGL